jgi:pyruvate dehydrogenase E1 component alpha subunit
MEAHSNADDASRYRPTGETEHWLALDPIARLDRYLRDKRLMDDSDAAAIDAEAERRASEMGQRMHDDTTPDPLDLFRYVYAEPTPSLQRQAQQLAYELTDGKDEER